MHTPPLPPRRKVPPVPPRRTTFVACQSSDSVDTTPVGGIAARITALQLDQVLGGLGAPVPRTQPGPNKEEPCAQPLAPNKRVNRTPSTAQALKRPPPPPPRQPSPEEEEPNKIPPPPPPRRVPTLPVRRVSNQPPPNEPALDDEDSPPPPPPARRLPPLLARVHTAPPPPVNRASRPVIPFSTRPALPVRELTPEPEPEYYEDEPQSEQPDTAPDLDPKTCLKCRSFDMVDAHAACFPREDQNSLEHLAYDLTSPFESPTDKARAIFTWLHHNINYDTYSFFNHCVKLSTPEGTLQSGLAVCEGYAGLFANIAAHAGLHALVINGHGKGFGYVAKESGQLPPVELNHAWNAVVLDDSQWHLVDACWGAGFVDGSGYQRRFAPQWFTSTNEEFGTKHFPTEDGHQMREDGMLTTWAEYILAPERPLEMSHFHEGGFTHDTLWPDVRHIASGHQHTFHVEKQCEHLDRREWEHYVLVLAVSKDGRDMNGERVIMDRDEEGGWTGRLNVPSGEAMVTMFAVDSWDGQDAKGLDPGIVRREWATKMMTFRGIVRWEAS